MNDCSDGCSAGVIQSGWVEVEAVAKMNEWEQRGNLLQNRFGYVPMVEATNHLGCTTLPCC